MGRVKDTKFGTNVSNKMLLSAAKCQGYSFYEQGGGVISSLGLNEFDLFPPHSMPNGALNLK